MLRSVLFIMLSNYFIFASTTPRLDSVETKNLELQKELQEQIVNLKVKDKEIEYLKNSIERLRSKLDVNNIDIKTYDTKIDDFDKRISDINFYLIAWGFLLTILLIAISVRYSKAAKREAKEAIEEWIKQEADSALTDKIGNHLKEDKRSFIENLIQNKINSSVSIEIKEINAVIQDIKDKTKEVETYINESKQELYNIRQIKNKTLVNMDLIVSTETDILDEEDIKNAKNKSTQQKEARDYYNLGLYAIEKQEYNNAIFNFKQSLDKNDDLEEDKIYFYLGNSYLYKKEYEKAIDAYEKAIKISPEYDSAYNNMGLAYYYKKEYKKAIDAYEKAIEINPEYNVYNNIGIVYAKKEDYNKAIDFYQKSLISNPKDSKTFYNLALSYKKLKDCKNALKNYKKAIRMDKNSYLSYINIGNIYFEVGKFNKAINYYKKAININSKKYQAYYNLGNIYYEIKEFENAIKYYKDAININPKIQNSYIDLFELQLIKNLSLDSELEKKYINIINNTKESKIKYDMLKVFENITKGEESRLNDWINEYKDVGLDDWSFNELEEWINGYENGDIKAKLLEALNVFKNHKT